MSFILDALRKSESERQQDARPSITRIPDAIQHNKLPAWALGTITLLGVGVLVLAVAWWRAQPEATVVARSPIERPAVRTPLRVPAQTDSRPAPSALAGAASSGARSTLRSAVGSESTPQGQSQARAQAEASQIEGISRPSAADLPRVESTLRDYASMSAQLDLPELRLELHSYADDAAKRFVFINGARYREGDTLSEGPRLIAINARGAVLIAKNQQLLLGRE